MTQEMEDEDGWNHDRYIVPDIVLRQCQGLFYMAKRVESQRHDLKIRSIYFMLIYRSTHFYHEEEIKMKITLKDGSVKEYAEAKSVYDIASDISAGLARVACAGEVNGEIVDLRTVVDQDCELNIVTASDPEGLRVIRHTALTCWLRRLRECSQMRRSLSDRQSTMVSIMILKQNHFQEMIWINWKQR